MVKYHFSFMHLDNLDSQLPHHDYACAPRSDAEKLAAALERIAKLEEEVRKLKEEKFGLHKIQNDDYLTKFYTGFHSYKMFNDFFDSIKDHAAEMITYLQNKRLNTEQTKTLCARKQAKLSLKEQLFLFLHKVRLGSLDQDLADKFGVAQSTVSRNTVTWANFLYCILGSQNIWPSKQQLQEHIPKAFVPRYENVRVVLDCTELRVQSPSSLVMNSELYSNYKTTTTMKCLIGITPWGAISFVSNLYSGSISDKAITRCSGILDLLEAGDEVMADKGFVIDDLLEPKGCKLVIPHFLASKGQFTAEENAANAAVTNVRVHVERAIRRIKEYHIFDGIIPLTLAGSVNQLWAVCSLLTNFQGPLIRSSVA